VARPEASSWATGLPELARELATDLRAGLSTEEAARRLAADGANELRGAAGISALTILVQQFRSLVVWLLVAAALVSMTLGEVADGAAILAIVALNAGLGFFQEFRAERAVAALGRLAAPRARLVRDGRPVVAAAREVVRGDVLVLDAGDLVAADARLLDAAELSLNEASLTGESEPVEKRPGELALDTPLAERLNQVFLGTAVVRGSGRALVVATGMQTEVGRIARLLESASSGEAPLQLRLDRVARHLLAACLAIVGVVFALGWLRGIGAFELFLSAVSLAVAAVPEGLPAVVTVALALGVERMVRRHALMRSLPSVETLGSTQVICTDKTGTLTIGAMTLRRLVTPDGIYRVAGEGYSVAGSILGKGDEDAAGRDDVQRLLRVAAGCNEAELSRDGTTTTVAGDPTEVALLVAAAKGGIRREALDAEAPRLRTLPFDSDRKRMTVVRANGCAAHAYVKGAPETVLRLCTRLRTRSGEVPLDESSRARLEQAIAHLAADALRVLAFAERRVERPEEDALEEDLTFLGFAGLQDPPRAEARGAIARCHRAGIQVVMITGDHPNTARAIAAELGMLAPSDEVLSGSDLAKLDDGQLTDRVHRVRVYARVTAEDKLRIVRAWKGRGFVAAMTGDGVNDAPALREASVGIAMGITGTEVAKQASDMVITDDNFASIVAAVEEGRGVFDNVAKTLSYLLAGNAGELLLVLVATLAGYPLPLLPIQLLWINLVTDGLPALALATDPIDPGVLARPPRSAAADLLDRSRLAGIGLTGCLTAGVAFGAFAFELANGGEIAAARNAAFSTLVFAELLRAFGARSETRLVHEVGLFSNLRLFAIVTASFFLQLWIHHSELLGRLFGTEPITLGECAAWVALGMVPLLVLELGKWARRAKRVTSGPAGSGASPS
jgi:Ca2+-transporting ATPase